MLEDGIIRELATRSSLPTRAHYLGVEGACIQVKAITLALKESNLSDLTKKLSFLDELLAFTISEEYEPQLKISKRLLEEYCPLVDASRLLGSNVTVLRSVPFSIHAFLWSPSDYERNLLAVVQTARDKDTVGAMTDALLGSYLGVKKIPNTWINKLENEELIKHCAKQLFLSVMK